MSTARAGIGKLIEHTVPFLFVIMPPPSCPIQVGADAIKVIPYLCPPPPSNQVGTDAMNAMAQSKKVEEALGQAVVAGEALKRGLAQEGARGDQVGVERDREEECTEKWTRGLPSRGAHQFAGGHVGRLRIENILANAQSHPRYVSLPQAEGVAADLQRELAETSSSLEEQRGLLKKVGFWGAGGN